MLALGATYLLMIAMSPLNDCSVSVAPASPNDPRTDRLRPGVKELPAAGCNVSA